MKKFIIFTECLLLILISLLLTTCEKPEYDLFPLKEGNEFYFTYYKYRYIGVNEYTKGNERWKIVSVFSDGNSNVYKVERKLNAVLQVFGQAITISDSLRFFEVSENKSTSELSSSTMFQFTEIRFRRYQNDPMFEMKKECLSGVLGWNYLFKADSGLTKFGYCHPPNQITNESLHLDSLKIYH